MKADNADSPILWTQNGMDNFGIDAVNMNDAAKIASVNSGTQYGATVSVYNATNTFMGDALKMKIGSLLNRVGFSALEPADHTWDRIIQSGKLDNGGRIIAHSQGAFIATEAIERNIKVGDDKGKKIDLILAGGAQSNIPSQLVRNVTNLKNEKDNIPLLARTGGLLFLDPIFEHGSPLDRGINFVKDSSRRAFNSMFGTQIPASNPVNNYYSHNQDIDVKDKDGKKLRLWGGDKYNGYVNGDGHSFLQYMNGVNYADTEYLSRLKSVETPQTQPKVEP